MCWISVTQIIQRKVLTSGFGSLEKLYLKTVIIRNSEQTKVLMQTDWNSEELPKHTSQQNQLWRFIFTFLKKQMSQIQFHFSTYYQLEYEERYLKREWNKISTYPGWNILHVIDLN